MNSAEDVLVGPDWIAEHVADEAVRVIEVDVSSAAYDAGHIPGALLWNAYSDLRHPDYTPVDHVGLARLLSASGVTPETTIVFYGYAPYLGLWLLKRHGHDRVRVMDGPRERWEGSWETVAPAPKPTSYPIPAAASIGSSHETVRAMIGEAGHILLDVRSLAEFAGERFWPSGATEGAGRPGHVPSAVHIPIDTLRTEDGTFYEPVVLRGCFEEKGITPEQRVVVYCTIGNRASQAWFALTYLLEYPSADIYYGSWAEWGSLPETPID